MMLMFITSGCVCIYIYMYMLIMYAMLYLVTQYYSNNINNGHIIRSIIDKLGIASVGKIEDWLIIMGPISL